jgi:hypothetical protein
VERIEDVNSRASANRHCVYKASARDKRISGFSASPDPMMAQEAAHFTKMLYTTRLSKYSSPTILSDAGDETESKSNDSRNSNSSVGDIKEFFMSWSNASSQAECI